MKRIIAIFALILVGTFASAQQATTTTVTNAERAHSQAMKYQKMLTLTEQQTPQIEAILLAKFDAIDAVNADMNKTKEQKEADIAQINTDKENEILALLTAEQVIRYNEVKSKREQRRQATGQQ